VRFLYSGGSYNNSGQIIGEYDNHSFLYSNGSYTTIAPPGSSASNVSFGRSTPQAIKRKVARRASHATTLGMGKLRSGKSGATLDDALSCEQHLLRGKVMRIRRYIGLCAVVLAASVSASFAGPCWDEIGAMQAKIDARLESIAAARPPATASAMEGMNSPQPTPRAIAGEDRMGEIRPETVQAIQQGMAQARAADNSGDKAACAPTSGAHSSTCCLLDRYV
jgi:hypothetical protein